MLPNIKKGELATVMTNGTPMCNIIPKEERTASPAEKTPNVATHTLFLTQSNLQKNIFLYDKGLKYTDTYIEIRKLKKHHSNV